MGLNITPLIQLQPIEEEEEELQMKPLSGQLDPSVQKQPLEEEEEEEVLQTQASPGHAPTMTPEMQARINGMRGGGQPLPGSARAYFEPRFGHDFSQVRIHTDAQAANTARGMKAQAYTFGRDIVFGAQQFVPETQKGKYLLAHELTHVVQQGKGATAWKERRASRAVSSGADAGVDRPAATNGNGIAAGTPPQTTSAGVIQRLPFGIRLPTGTRFLDPAAEKPLARSVYGGSIILSRVLISNALGGGGRPFTLYTPIPVLGDVTVINAGPSLYSTPGSNPNLLIHELAHSWQSQHHPNPAQYMVNSVLSQAAGGSGAYCYRPGRWFGLYGAEQIAQQAERGVAPIVAHMKSTSPGVPDIGNIASLSVPRWETRGATGVRC
ncbi:MAG: DUF4157 domain-containing protein [Desulfobacterales bacterium]|nr:MAG: DUF4157 domain-containing protein [Desulfobacterales bacterium]